jgi:hypothetical protein
MGLSQYTSPEFLAEDRGPTITATACLLIFFCTSFVALRYYSRYLTSTSFNIEDVLVLFAWLAEVGLCIVGVGRYATPSRLVASTDLLFSHG